MKEYLRERKKTEDRSKVTGIVLTVLLHASALCLVSFSGLNYIYPPPEETSFLLDFTEEEDPQFKPVYGREPQGEDVDREKDVELVQKSESPNESLAQNLTPAAKPDDFGDVETPEPPREEEPKLDPRAAFPGMAKKDTTLTAPHNAREASSDFRAGQATGNTEKARTEGVANAHVEGRKVNKSTLVKPGYGVQESGKIVMDIWVDNYGNVIKAIVGDGTTISNTKLIAEARAAAMKAHFDQKIDAPAMQEGTITYIFNLQ
jgi:hypothetical protein